MREMSKLLHTRKKQCTQRGPLTRGGKRAARPRTNAASFDIFDARTGPQSPIDAIGDEDILLD
jgi:hypothetical protein